MDSLVRPIIGTYQISNGILATSIRDLSDQDAKQRSRNATGPSIAWTIGHLCNYKIQVLGLLGNPRENPYKAKFESAPATDGADYPPLAELAAQFASLNAEVCAALESSAARLEEVMPNSGPHAEKRVLDTVLFLAWHEAYHVGSVGYIRKELGKREISDLVTGQ